MSTATGPVLLERDGELAVLDGMIGRVPAGHAGFVVVTGPAGIGKKALLAAIERRVQSAGVGVLRATGAEFERELAYGGVVQLFEARLRALPDDERAELLGEGAARLAGELLGFVPGRLGESGPDTAFAATHGLYWLCVNLAARSPIVLLIDDAHWLDEPSLRWIEYLARRREALPILIVVTIRPEEALGQRVVRTASETGGDLIELRPLSGDAVHDLIVATLDQSVETEFGDAFQKATGGNPYFVHELLRTIHEEGIVPDRQGVRAVQTLGSGRVGRAVLVRLHRLSPASVALAQALAILGRCGSLSVAARLARLDDTTAARAVDVLVAADVLAPGPDLQFRHPVVQASIRDDMPLPGRALRHRQAAGLLADIGSPARDVANQLLEAEPVGDRWTVDVLRAAATEASSRGAPRSAVAFLERALAEVPGSPDPDLLLQLGRAALGAPDISKAIDALTRALEGVGPSGRGTVVVDLVRAFLHAGEAEQAVRLLKTELGRIDVDPEQRVWLELECVLLVPPTDEAFAVTQHFRGFQGRNLAELTALGVASWTADTAEEATALAQRALAGGTLVRALDAAEPWFLAPWMLIRADRLDEAAGVVEAAIERSRTIGSQSSFALSSWLRAEVDYRCGDLLSAEANARSAFTIGCEGGSLWIRLMSGALLAQVLTDRGQLDEADEVLRALDLSTLPPSERLTRTVHYARAYVALAAGRPTDTLAELDHLKESDPETPAWPARFPTGMTVRAIALSRLGRVDEAREHATEELAGAKLWGARRYIGLALRARASTVDSTERVATLQTAVDVLEHTPADLELARALGELGSTLRRLNQRAAAREPLRRALDLARRCRADTLAEHLRRELATAGARPRREVLSGKDSLTASEARIADMAATGLTNLQIAQAIFLTPATVEKHLTSVYAKLAVSSRRQLAAALRTGSPA